MDLKPLRVLAIAGPLVFLLMLAGLGILALLPTLNNNPVLRLALIFAALAVAAVMYSFWVFAAIARQERDLQKRNAELDAAHHQVAQHDRQLDAVNQAVRAISSALDLDLVLQNITDAARVLIDCRYAALGVSDGEGKILQFITSGITTEQRARIGPLPVGRGLLGVLIKEGHPIRVRDIAMDPRGSGFPPNHPPMRSLLGVPVQFQGRLVGDLYLTDKIAAPEFNQDDEEMLLLLANHAAVAIENARLYQDARSSRDRLQAWNDQLEAIVAERTRQIERSSRELTTHILQAQEEERKRIARELHDDTAQSLSSMLITLDLLAPRIPAEDALLNTGFERVVGLAKRTLDEVRDLSHSLRPAILDDFGLVAALRWFADEFVQTYGFPVEIVTEPVPNQRLSPDMELALFRIGQEALTNTGKYAHAKQARLTLSFPDESAQLIVEDDGKGFVLGELAGPSRQGGFGLYGMRERAELLHGTLTIETAPGKGTRTTVRVPLQTFDRDIVAVAGTSWHGAESC